jgi:hypothetical protein
MNPILIVFTAFFTLTTVRADDPHLPYAHLDRLLAEIKPQRNESPWREIHWLTDVTEARRQAVVQDKPLVIFTAADGSPLGRT